MHNYELTILEHHLDSFGHVNNAAYLEIYEEARWDMVTPRGYGYKEVHEHQIGPVILDVSLSFRRELVLRETIRVESKTIKWDGKIGQIEQKIFKEGDVLASKATFTIGLFDLRARRLIPPTPEWLKAIDWPASSDKR